MNYTSHSPGEENKHGLSAIERERISFRCICKAADLHQYLNVWLIIRLKITFNQCCVVYFYSSFTAL